VSRDLLLAIDLGTTGVRARVTEGGGALLGGAHRALPVAFPEPGRVEQDPDSLHTLSVEVARQALTAARCGAEDIAALGIATQRATALAWDAETGRALAPAVGWQDQRVARGLEQLRARGLPIGTQPSLAKFLWWLEEEPAVREAAKAGRLCFGTPDVWLGHRWSGGELFATDPGQAGCTGLYDPNSGGWAGGFLEILGIDAAWLPEIVASAGALAETTRDALGAAIPLAARAGDQQASAFAAGLRQKGEAKLTLGTAAMVDRHTGASPEPPTPGTVPLPLWRLPDAGESFCLEGHVTTAGAALEWCVSLGLAPDVAGLDALAATSPDSGGVVVIPAFQGVGTPHAAEEARGLVGGLTRGSGAAELARAAFEGVAHRCVDVWEALEPEDATIRTDGGLSQSRLLLQLLADLSGKPVRRADDVEGTALGAAGLAALGVGLDVAPAARGGVTFEPALSEDERAGRRARWQRCVRERVLTGEAEAAA